MGEDEKAIALKFLCNAVGR